MNISTVLKTRKFLKMRLAQDSQIKKAFSNIRITHAGSSLFGLASCSEHDREFFWLDGRHLRRKGALTGNCCPPDLLL